MESTTNAGRPRKRWVVKIGSSLLTNHGRGLALDAMANWVQQVVELRKLGIETVIVSSGAVAEGMARLGWQKRPSAVHELQAAAAVGQMGLIQAYESAFQKHGIHTAQILLTHDDLTSRKRYLNARTTLRTLLALNIVPIVNENDTVVTDEIKFGDNDTLGALVTNLVEAEQLILLTDKSGLYTADPGVRPDATMIKKASANDTSLREMASAGKAGQLGRGGMLTKVLASERAARSGATTVIAAGARPNVLLDIAAETEDAGTWIYPAQEPLAARKQWLAGHLQVKGTLVLDQGAVNVLKTAGKSLLPVGVKQLSGKFQRGEAVLCVDEQGKNIAHGLVNYDSDEALKIIGKPSKEIEHLLGYIDEPELIHRDNLVLM